VKLNLGKSRVKNQSILRSFAHLKRLFLSSTSERLKGESLFSHFRTKVLVPIMLHIIVLL